MPNNIDERVVKMGFDGEEFERGTKKTMTALEKLKESLKFKDSAKGFDNISKAASQVKLNPITNAVETVAVKFNALERVATGALMRIGQQAVDAGEKLLKSLTTDNIAAGWQKFGDKTTSIATLLGQGFDESEVDEQFDRLNAFTDETSYNLSDMVSNISKFTATGKGLEESVTAMQGIALWAAASGQGAVKASQAMYQLSQAMGKGALKYDDWKSIQNASMDTQEFREQAVATAVALGQLKKTGEDTYQTLGNKSFTLTELFTSDALSREAWFTSEVMMDTFKKYSSAADDLIKAVYVDGTYDTVSKAIEGMGDELDAFGLKVFKAGQEARTWADVVSSVKDAVGTGWMNTFSALIGTTTEATKLWTSMANELWEVFAGGFEARNEFLEGVFGDRSTVSVDAEKWSEIFKDNASAAETFKMALSDTAKEAGISLDTIIEKAGSFEESLSQGWLTTDLFNKALDRTESTASSAAKTVEDYQKVAYDLWQGKYGYGLDRKQKIEDQGFDYDILKWFRPGDKNSIAKLEKILGEQMGTTSAYTEEQIEQLKNLKEQAGDTATGIGALYAALNDDNGKVAGRTLLFEGLANVYKTVKESIQAVKESFKNMFPGPTVDQVYGVIERFHEWTETLRDPKAITKRILKIRKAVDTLTGGLKTLANIAKAVFGGIGKFLKIVVGAFKTEGTTLTDKIKLIGDGLSESGDGFSKFISKIKEKVPILGLLVSGFGDLVDFVGRFVEACRVFVTGGGFSGFFETLGGDIETANTNIQEFIEGVQKKIDSINWNKVLGFTIGVGVSTLVLYIARAFTDLGQLVKTGKNLLGNLNGIFLKLKNGLNNNVISIGQSFILFAVAIGILIGAIKLLSTIPYDEVGRYAGIIGAFAGGLAVMGIAIAFLSKLKIGDIKPFVAVILSIAGSALLLALAVKSLNNMGLGETAKGLGAIFLSIFMVLSMANKVAKHSKDSIEVAAVFLAIAGAVWVMFDAIKKLSGIGAWDTIKALGLLVVALAGMALIIHASKGSVLSSAGALLAIGFAFYLIIGVFRKLANPRVYRDLKQALKNLQETPEIIAAMLVTLMVMSAATWLAGGGGGKIAGVGVAMVGMALSLLLLITAMRKIAALKFTKGEAAGVLVVMAVLTGIIFVMAKALDSVFHNANPLKSSFGILLMVSSLLILYIAVKKFGQLDPTTLGKGLLTVVSLLLSVAAIAKGSQGMGSFKSFLGVILSIAAVTAALAFLMRYDLEALKSRAIVLGSLLVALAGSVWIIGKSSFAGSAKSLLALIPMVVALGAIVAALWFLSNYADADAMAKIAVSIVQVLLTLVGAIAVLAIPGVALNGAIGLATVVAITALILGIAGAIAQIDGAQEILEAGVGVFEQIGFAIGTLIGAIGEGVTQHLPQIGQNLSDFAEKVQPFIDAMTGIDPASLEGAKTLVDVISTLVKADALNTLTTWFKGLTGQKPDDGFKNLMTMLGEAMGAFSESTKNLDPERIAPLASAAASLATAADIFSDESFKNVDPAAVSAFGRAMSTLSGSLVAISGNADKIDATKIENVSKAVTPLVELSKTLKGEGGIFQKIFGENQSLADFSTDISAFATAINDFQEKAPKKVDETLFENTKNAAAHLVELSNALTADGGLWQNMFGSKDLGGFGTQLAAFGQSLSDFSDATEGADLTRIRSLAVSVKDFVEANSNLAMYGNGGNLQTFGYYLTSFGGYLVSFINKVSEEAADWESVVPTITEGIEALASAETTLSNLGEGFGGSVNDAFNAALSEAVPTEGIDAFINNISEELSTKVKELMDEIRDTLDEDAEEVVSSTSEGETPGWLTKLGEFKETVGGIVGGIDMESFGSSLDGLLGKLQSFSTGEGGAAAEGAGQGVGDRFMSGLLSKVSADGEAGTNLFTGIQNLFSGFSEADATISEAGKTMMDNFVAGMQEKANETGAGSASEAAGTLVQSALTQIDSLFGSFTEKGMSSVDGFVQGLQATEKATAVSNAGSDLANNVIEAIKAKYDEFVSAAQNSVDGLLGGLTNPSNLSALYNAGALMADQVNRGYTDTLAIASPSRVFFKFGQYTDQGLINGIYSMLGQVRESGEALGSEAIFGSQTAISIIGEMAGSDVVFSPVVRPVLDLTNVQNGSKQISAIFSRKQALAAGSGFRSYSGSSDARSATKSGTTYTFTQNNYSPKALSRQEIYRQTKNQFNSFERQMKYK